MNLETRIFNACIWFLSLCILLAILTSCNPYQDVQIPTATAASKGNNVVTLATPLPYWQLAALDPWQSIGSISNSKAGH